jgi:uncharacterized protein (UPF0210 family)
LEKFMKIRSLTYFDKPGNPLEDEFISRAVRFCDRARDAFEDKGFEVQTVRFASPPFPTFLDPRKSDQLIRYAIELETFLQECGYSYISLGPAIPDQPDSYPIIPDLIQSTTISFCSGLLTAPGKGVSLSAVRSCGDIIFQLAPQDENGFANLYFAALGNVPHGAPYFPAAFHTTTGKPEFSIAIEAADLALNAFSESASFDQARGHLVSEIENVGEQLSQIAREVQGSTGAGFAGIDCSLAPFPDSGQSLGLALEKTGLDSLGDHGSLAASAFLADAIDRADFKRTGFSGLMLPVLEDSTLAARAAEGSLTLRDLLMYAAVCGTGLDTIPLPGSVSGEQISAVLFDLAALSLRLDKPLTARLMPIPGKEAGDPTTFDFPFFANSKVMDIQAEPLKNFYLQDGYLDIRPRPKN